MVTNSFGKINFMQSMGSPNHALKVACFFFFLSFGGGEKDFFSYFLWFPMCSHPVPGQFEE
jgi:hypothetical protein